MINLDISRDLLYNAIITENFENGKADFMSVEKKNGNEGGILAKIVSGFSGLFKSLFKREDPSYDDGYGYDATSEDNGKARFLYVIMSVYGFISGALGCQYVKYLHQRYACNAWGIPLTSRHVEPYSLPNVIIDVLAFGVIYFFVLAIGVLLNRLLKMYFDSKMSNATEVANIGLAYGFAFIAISSILFFFLRFNIFLIGVD